MSALSSLMMRLRFGLWAPLRVGGFPSFYDSHSQFGEDMVVRALVGERNEGTYVDIGAHHPVYFSNTYHFYRRGWRGLNVDALPGSMEAFNVLRPGDVNVEACVAPTSGQSVTLHVFEDAALTTIDTEAAEYLVSTGKRRLSTSTVACLTLTECLDRHLPGRHVDLLSIDIEGLDEAILRSHRWDLMRPSVLVFERHGVSALDAPRDPLIAFLQERGYVLEGICGPSFIMRQALAD